MTTRRCLTLLVIFGLALLAVSSRAATPASEPFLVETKVQVDLENALSRVIPREQFLVRVNTEVGNRVERRIVEGETTTTRPEPTQAPIPVMPGFLPEAQVKPQNPAPQMRELYRLVETPVLNSVLVHVSFDETVAPETISRCKSLVQEYLREAYPNKAVITFSQIPMLKKKTDDPEADRKVASEEEETPEEKMWNYARWGALALLAVAVLMLWTRQTAMSAAGARSGGGRRAPKSSNPWDSADALSQMGARGALEAGMNRAMGFARAALAPPPVDQSPDAIEHLLEARRRKLLNKFLLKSEAFRIYYSRLDDEGRSELYAALNGPAFESLLDGLGLVKMPSEESDATRLDERLAHHERQFEEFAAAKEWQDRQFFGFLSQLSDDQLTALVSHETPLAAALMLRHMKANQSATVLDSLTAHRRVEVLQAVKDVQELPLSKMAAIEREVRQAAQKVPQHSFAKPDEEVNFWGNVLTESRDQESLIADLEHTHPEIAPKLAKYKFKLEDAATLPNGILERVLGDAENDELGLALSTCSQDVVEVLLDAVSPRRRDLLLSQLDTYRGSPADQTQAARVRLTKRFRESLG